MPSRQARAAAGSRVAAREQQLGAVGEVRLPVGTAQVGERVERPAVADRGEDVVELAVGGRGVVDVVGDDDREAEVRGEGRRLGHEPVVVGAAVVRQLEEEAARCRRVATTELAGIALGDRLARRLDRRPGADA